MPGLYTWSPWGRLPLVMATTAHDIYTYTFFFFWPSSSMTLIFRLKRVGRMMTTTARGRRHGRHDGIGRTVSSTLFTLVAACYRHRVFFLKKYSSLLLSSSLNGATRINDVCREKRTQQEERSPCCTTRSIQPTDDGHLVPRRVEWPDAMETDRATH